MQRPDPPALPFRQVPVPLPVPVHLNPAPAGPPWKCNCVKHCKGVLHEVSKRQYDLHAPFRTRPEDVLAHLHFPAPPTGSALAPVRAVPSIFKPVRPQADNDAYADMPGLDTDDESDDEDDDDDRAAAGGAGIAPHSPVHAPSPPSNDSAPASPHANDQVFYPPLDADELAVPRPLTPPVDPEFGYTEDNGAPLEARRKEVRDTHAFIHGLKNARLDDSGLSEETLERLRTPRRAPAAMTAAQRAALRMFTARGDASEENYSDNRDAFKEVTDEDIPTYEQLKCLVSDLTGIDAIHAEMCVNTCVAYVGPFATYEQCPHCGESRYDAWKLAQGKQVARRTFQTYPLGPQLQAMWASPENALLMKHRARETQRIIDAAKEDPTALPDYNDVYYGQAYLDRVQEEDQTRAIKPEDMVLMFSIDGAQLYESKASDCWFYVWVLFDLPPDARYKKRYVLPGAVIGGPRKPKEIDSFLFPGLLHLAALQREGLQVWDAAEDRIFRSDLFLLLATADGPAMAYLNGLVGHQGAHGCRLYCPFPGRNKTGGSMYYPAALRPDPPNDNDHADISLRHDHEQGGEATRERYETNLRIVENSRNKTVYARNRLLTGIAKPSIFSGLPRSLGVPDIFGADMMHLLSLNLPDLILGLLRGTLICEAPDTRDRWPWAIFLNNDIWVAHGKLVAEATRYLPGSFDRPPRNPAEKISSGFKAWEYLLYIYGLLPGLLRPLLQPIYYRHLCKLIHAVRELLQRKLPADVLPEAHRHFVEYAEGLETLYYQRHRERLHFIRQSVHATTHIVSEVNRLGPGSLYTQWTLENYIGNITREIKQHSTPYANVSERALRRCQVNALKAMFPFLAEDTPLPRGAIDIGMGYILLQAMDTRTRGVTNPEGLAVLAYLDSIGAPLPGWTPLVRHWARLRLPNGQIARSAWKECVLEARGRKPRRARMIKLDEKPSRFAEVQFYFILEVQGIPRTLAMIAPFSAPDVAILAESENTVIACNYPSEDTREVVEITKIISVVAMVPLPMTDNEANEDNGDYGSRFFVVEKPGQDVAILAGREEPIQAHEDDIE